MNKLYRIILGVIVFGCQHVLLNATPTFLTCTSPPKTPGGIVVSGGDAKVCSNETRTYSVTAVLDADSYTWTAPTGASITSGQTTNVINVSFNAGFTSAGTLSVTASNACGTSGARTLTISPNYPSQPSTITGNVNGACPNTSGTYSVVAVSGVAYSWTAPSGASITAGQGTNAVTVSFTGSFTSGALTVLAYSPCASSPTRSLTIYSVTSMPGNITVSGGSAKVCPGESRSYSISSVAGASSYAWTAPAGASITAGQGTTSISVGFTSSFTATGALSVTTGNSCGISAPRTLSIIPNTPGQPGTIAGAVTSVCANTSGTYSVTGVNGFSYSWTAPAGASITSGQGTNAVSVNFSGAFTTGVISVYAYNACGSSSSRSLTINSIPGMPGAITGLLYNNCGKTSVYAISKVTAATSYVWSTNIAGATIDVAPSPNDTMATIHYPQFTSGSLMVNAVNGCGLSATRSLTVKGTLPAPSAISGTTNFSPCHDEVYSVFNLFGASSYLWAVPPGSSIVSGINTNSITVHFGNTNGNITVKGMNACGGGLSRTLGVVMAVPVPTGLNTTNITTTGATLNWTTIPQANSYNVQYRVVGALSWIPATSTTNSISISSLTPASNYEWQVQGVCSSVISSFSSTANFTTATPNCGTPTGLGSSGITTTSALLSWSPVSGAVSYSVQYRIAGTYSWNPASSTTTSLSVSSLTPSSNYEFQVKTNCSLNSSSFSASSNFTTLTPCGMPGGLSSGSVTTTSALLSWTPVSGAVSYDVQYRVVGALSWIPATSTATSLSVSSLTPASNYEFQVKTNCSQNASSFSSSANFTTLTPPCDVPTGLSAGSITTTSASLSWTAVSGAVTYNIQYRTIGGSWSSTTSATNSKSISGLTTGKTYEWQVQTACQYSNGNYSASSSFTTTNTSVSLVRKAYLQMVSPTAANIRWRTNIATNSRVRVGTTMGYGTTVDSSTSTTEHEIRITGLTANTKYYYTIGSSTVDLQGDPNYFVKTALPAGNTSAFRVWATGDFGNNSAGQTATQTAFVNYTATTSADMWLWLGDNAYNAGLDSEFTANVFSIYPNQLRNIPLYPCLGNHDYANIGYQSASALGTNFPYFNSFSCFTNAEGGGTASGTEKYYSFNYGNVHFITLDSYGALNASGSAMYNWLQSDLIANTQRWIVVNWHHPPYSMGTHNSDTETEMVNMRNNILPLLETYKVDLVLCGHSHTYERSFLLKGHFGLESTLTAGMKIDAGSGNSPYYQKSSPNYDGTVYVVCGVAGQGGSVSVQASWPHAAMYSYAKTLFGSMIIDFNNDTLNAQFLTSTGTINDQFKIVKSGSPRLGGNMLIEEGSNEDMVVYPNPFTNETMLRYKLREATPLTIEIFDMTGSKVYSSDALFKDAGVYEIALNGDMLNNKKGIFIIRIISNAGAQSKIIERVE